MFTYTICMQSFVTAKKLGEKRKIRRLKFWVINHVLGEVKQKISKKCISKLQSLLYKGGACVYRSDQLYFPCLCAISKIPCIWSVLFFFYYYKSSTCSLFPIFHGHTQLWIHSHVVHLFQLFPQKKFSQVRVEGQMTFHIKTFVNPPKCPPEGHAILDFH